MKTLRRQFIRGEADLTLFVLIGVVLALTGAAAWYFLSAPSTPAEIASPAPPKFPVPSTPLPKSTPGPVPATPVAAIVETTAGAVAASETAKKLIEKANEARANNEALQLKSALMSYFTEYRRYPEISGAEKGRDTETTSNAALVEILTGKNSSKNPRGIRFIDPRPRSLNSDGALVDPWGNPYRVFLDSNYDSSLTVDGKKIYIEVEVRSSGGEKKKEGESNAKPE